MNEQESTEMQLHMVRELQRRERVLLEKNTALRAALEASTELIKRMSLLHGTIKGHDECIKQIAVNEAALKGGG